MNRREWVSAVAGGTLLCALPIGASAQSDATFWAQPRRLRLVRPQTGQSLDEVYWADGKLAIPGYIRICHLLRDAQSDSTVQMDLRLLDLMRAVQAYVEYYGYKGPLNISSGYRSPKTNNRTEGAARNSQHLAGRAVDFTMPGLPSNYMGLLVSHYKAGGVGFYPTAGFTHIDTGNVRYWMNKR